MKGGKGKRKWKGGGGIKSNGQVDDNSRNIEGRGLLRGIFSSAIIASEGKLSTREGVVDWPSSNETASASD